MLGNPHDQSTVTRKAFYRIVLEHLNESNVPYLVGGGYCLERYTGICRDDRDLDILVRPADATGVLKAMRDRGHRTELCFSHWLAKVFGENDIVDVIFSSGNGVCRVDNQWFEHAVASEILGISVNLCPAEELIWTKAFIMERERYDGADIAHLLRTCGAQLDWSRLLRRFEHHWRVLLSHLILFRFIYPDEGDRVPFWVTRHLLERIQDGNNEPSGDHRLCRGTLLSRSQYLADVEAWGYKDARQLPTGSMTPEEAINWSHAGEVQGEREQPERCYCGDRSRFKA